jgi:ammonium transporter, Amt family
VVPATALIIGLLAGLSVPFVAFVIDRLLRLDDAAGILSMSGLPALIGLLAVGIWADGTLGSGWQMAGVDNYLGVTGQGVSGIFVAPGYQPDLPGQIQAQIIGVLALWLWGFISGLLLCVPMAIIAFGLQRSDPPPRQEQPQPRPFTPQVPVETPTASSGRSSPGPGGVPVSVEQER